MKRCNLEFVIEPFVEDAPGPHVVSGIRAVEAKGLEVSMGPFGSTASGSVDAVSEGIGAMVAEAVKNGAQRVLVEVVIDEQ